MMMSSTSAPAAAAPVAASDPASDAGLRLDRVAGLAVERLPPALVEADDLAALLDAQAAELAATGERLSEALYALVPLLDDDRALRRGVLALRRATRAEGARIPAPPLLDRVYGALERHRLDAAALEAWVGALRRCEELDEALVAATASGVRRATRALEALRDDDDFMSAVADASCDFAAAPGRQPLLPGRHAARSLLAYATRAALKTSPFAGLTTVGLAGSRPARSTAAVTHAYAAAWLDVLAHDETAMLAFDVEALDTGGLDPASDAVAVPVLVESDEFIWRRSAVVHLRQAGPVLARLQRVGRVSASALLEIIGGEDPFAVYVRLLDSGLLRVVAPWKLGEHDALAVLSEHLRTRLPGHPLSVTLSDLVQGAQGVLDGRGRDRATRRVSLRDRAQRALRERGASAARSRFELYVDTAPGEAASGPEERASAEIERFADALGARVRRSTAYEAVVAHFVARHGAGATVPSAWPWLLEAGSDEALLSKVHAPRASASDRPRGTSMPMPSAAMTVQIAGPESLVVVNQVLDGQGGIATRFARLHDGPDGIAARVAARARRLAAGARAVEFVPSADVNGMQAAASGVLPRLRLPVDGPCRRAGDEETAVAALAIRHDPVADALELVDLAGRPVAPFYLGLVPSHLLSGPDRILAVLANPWRVPRVGASVFPTLSDPQRIIDEPRRTDGSVVVQRARWSVPRELLPSFPDADAALLRAAGRWRREHGIPPEVFVRLIRERPGFDPVTRKPIPVELRSPHALRHLAAEIDDTVIGLEITEALPSRAQFPHVDREGGHRAVEHLVFLSWTRP